LGSRRWQSVRRSPPTRYTPPRELTPVPFFSWTGFYLGINGGCGLGRSNWTDTITAVASGGFDLSGAMVGGLNFRF
jgi:hypothetical protein